MASPAVAQAAALVFGESCFASGGHDLDDLPGLLRFAQLEQPHGDAAQPEDSFARVGRGAQVLRGPIEKFQFLLLTQAGRRATVPSSAKAFMYSASSSDSKTASASSGSAAYSSGIFHETKRFLLALLKCALT